MGDLQKAIVYKTPDHPGYTCRLYEIYWIRTWQPLDESTSFVCVDVAVLCFHQNA
eukprot:TRINITY_DN16609_c0_g1_i1.p1 TRINITY_DN16609_c0_g1~~TRINITY_DN16609_c0_g1_i1.p1  ORF type:complete len:55 (+),score=7.41 TRINITY_DN16609_c0_g1_i1:131-295(+)